MFPNKFRLVTAMHLNGPLPQVKTLLKLLVLSTTFAGPPLDPGIKQRMMHSSPFKTPLSTVRHSPFLSTTHLFVSKPTVQDTLLGQYFLNSKMVPGDPWPSLPKLSATLNAITTFMIRNYFQS